MHIQGEQSAQEQLGERCDDLSSCNTEKVQTRSEVKVVGHKSYTADLYKLEVLMEKK